MLDLSVENNTWCQSAIIVDGSSGTELCGTVNDTTTFALV